MARRLRMIVICVLSLVLLCGVVWAAYELAGQSNKTAADAGSSAADMEMASIDSVKPSTKAPATSQTQSKESSLRNKVKSADDKYKASLSTAKSEISGSGKVSEGTRNKGMGHARAFRDANEEFAKYWDSQNLPSRARLAREAGASRMASADMAFNEVDSAKIDAYNRQQNSLREAQSAYLKDAKEDTTDEDRAAIKSGLKTSLNKVNNDVDSLYSTAVSLLSQVQQHVGLVTSPPTVGGCARQIVSNPTLLTSDNPADGIANLLGPLQALVSLLSNMGGNLDTLLADVDAL